MLEHIRPLLHLQMVIQQIYDGKLVNGRYRVTNLESRIGKYPISVNVSGYVEPSDIELVDNRNGR